MHALVTFTIKGNDKLSDWMKTDATTDYPSLRIDGTFLFFFCLRNKARGLYNTN